MTAKELYRIAYKGVRLLVEHEDIDMRGMTGEERRTQIPMYIMKAAAKSRMMFHQPLDRNGRPLEVTPQSK